MELCHLGALVSKDTLVDAVGKQAADHSQGAQVARSKAEFETG